MNDTVFDLYAFEQGRWALVGSFDAARKEEALVRAKALSDDATVQAVRVLRDSLALDRPVPIYKTQRVEGLPEINAALAKAAKRPGPALAGRGGEAGRKSGKRPAKARGGGLDLELSPQAKLGLGLLAS
ncbi:MAG: hypothetical protein FJX47_18700, partial [Alphaproteobacteria bacterium]|nr:hypothetical protein [Alphaproteobacteria bacterium]